jgi:two-component system, cell cycle response regulator DivK
MKTILYIEDNRANQILVERILEPYQYRLLHADDGETGIQMALSETPDLILLDMGLPDVDGQTVVTLLRQMPALQEVPIVVLTAWPADKALEIAERYGCDGCLTKPVNVKTFPQQIAAFLYD